MSFSPALDRSRLQQLCTLVDTWIAEHSDALTRAAPAVSAWSAEQHIAHLALANELVLRNVKNLVKGSGLLVVRDAAQNEIGLNYLKMGWLPRGKAQSPRMVKPPEKVERELLLQWLGDARRELDAVDPATMKAGEVFVPHQVLGPLDAQQWLRFAVVHTRHHLVIARESLQAAGIDVVGLPEI